MDLGSGVAPLVFLFWFMLPGEAGVEVVFWFALDAALEGGVTAEKGGLLILFRIHSSFSSRNGGSFWSLSYCTVRSWMLHKERERERESVCVCVCVSICSFLGL